MHDVIVQLGNSATIVIYKNLWPLIMGKAKITEEKLKGKSRMYVICTRWLLKD